MKRRNFLKTTAAASAAIAAPAIRSADAQSRAETILVVVESGPNSMDIHGVGTTFRSYGACWNLNDRLLTFGRKTLSDGTLSYDYSKIEPELAEDYNVAADGMSVTFKMKKKAKFHDGTPVTAKDVKWSLDRAVSVGGFPTFQLKAGSLEKPEQFVVVDDHTFRVDFLRKDKLTLPDLAVPVPVILHSALYKKHATASDPWAMEWAKSNVVTTGAYRLEKWTPGQETIFARNDDWVGGPLPQAKRIIMREVPGAGNRRALMERGDADVSLDMPPKDAAEIKAGGKYKIVGVPVENFFRYVGMVVTMKPFDNPKVRLAVAHAVPYEQMFEAAVYKRGNPMWGGAGKPTTTDWPQPFPYKTDLAYAKKLLAEAGYADGFETTISIDMGEATVSEPEAVLLQQSLAQIGIKTTIEKIPGANFRKAMLEKNRPLHLASFGGWLNFPDYFYFWSYHGQNAVFNTMNYKNPALDKLVDEARFEADPAKYAELMKGFVGISMDDVPRAPLYQLYLDVGMQKNISGYTYWFHRQLDFRQLVKG